ncbi:ribbon-helix-helix domain-containing protein [Nostoc sp. ChiVER01]|uniref:ribbon-helix-helix domain-containing protein n=1 Tax=Nostoc sp. ChiVER01 TaxID=3075382 RepID=UPI002AD54BAE|nr:hypothetical protein [Nostoc sp. ChiVER01]MDZ8227887.1 hypothetical protein [Nostoc sp. ChiVER01]
MTADQYKGKRITITFPPDLYEKVDAAAKEENRSFSQQTVWLVLQAFKLMEEKQS